MRPPTPPTSRRVALLSALTLSCVSPYTQADLTQIQEPRLLVDDGEELRWPTLPLAGEGVQAPRDAASEAALVVDLSAYRHLPPRPGGEANAAAWVRYFGQIRGLREESIFLLQGAQAQPSAILAAVQSAGEMTGSGGALWIIVIGYGVTPLSQGSPTAGGALLTYDAPADDPHRSGHAVPILAMTKDVLDWVEAPVVMVLDACEPPSTDFSEAVLGGVEPRLYGSSWEPALSHYTPPTRGAPGKIETVSGGDGRRGVRGTVMTSGLGPRCLATLPGGRRPALSYLALGAIQGWGDPRPESAPRRRRRERRFFAADRRVSGVEALDFIASFSAAITEQRREAPPRVLGLSRRRMLLSEQAAAAPPTLESLLGLPEPASPVDPADPARSARASSFRFAGGAKIRRPRPRPGWGAQSPEVQENVAQLLEEAADPSVSPLGVEASWCHLHSPTPAVDRLIDDECTRWRRYVQRWRAFSPILDQDHAVLLRIVDSEPRAIGIAALRRFLEAYAQYPDHPRVLAVESALQAHLRGEPQGTWRALAAFGPSAAIEGGRYFRGCTDADPRCEADETPQMRSLSDYRIDRLEVARRDYDHCVDSGACDAVRLDTCYAWTGEGFAPGASLPEAFERPRAPQVCVTWAQAQNYCEWLGKRLPTELEWEVAARGGERRIYPWGQEEPDCEVANHGECGRLPWDVDAATTREDVFGLLHMAGNVGEWVQDHYRESYRRTRQRNPRGALGGGLRGIRGGSFYDPPEFLRASYRYAMTPDYGYATVGFRCAAD